MKSRGTSGVKKCILITIFIAPVDEALKLTNAPSLPFSSTFLIEMIKFCPKCDILLWIIKNKSDLQQFKQVWIDDPRMYARLFRLLGPDRTSWARDNIKEFLRIAQGQIPSQPTPSQRTLIALSRLTTRIIYNRPILGASLPEFVADQIIEDLQFNPNGYFQRLLRGPTVTGWPEHPFVNDQTSDSDSDVPTTKAVVKKKRKTKTKPLSILDNTATKRDDNGEGVAPPSFPTFANTQLHFQAHEMLPAQSKPKGDPTADLHVEVDPDYVPDEPHVPSKSKAKESGQVKNRSRSSVQLSKKKKRAVAAQGEEAGLEESEEPSAKSTAENSSTIPNAHKKGVTSRGGRHGNELKGKTRTLEVVSESGEAVSSDDPPTKKKRTPGAEQLTTGGTTQSANGVRADRFKLSATKHTDKGKGKKGGSTSTPNATASQAPTLSHGQAGRIAGAQNHLVGSTRALSAQQTSKLQEFLGGIKVPRFKQE